MIPWLIGLVMVLFSPTIYIVIDGLFASVITFSFIVYLWVCLMLLCLSSFRNCYFHAKGMFCTDVNVLSNVDENRLNIWSFIQGNCVISIIADLLDATFQGNVVIPVVAVLLDINF